MPWSKKPKIKMLWKYLKIKSHIGRWKKKLSTIMNFLTNDRKQESESLSIEIQQLVTNRTLALYWSHKAHVWQIRRDKQYQLHWSDCPNPAKYKHSLVLLEGKHALGERVTDSLTAFLIHMWIKFSACTEKQNHTTNVELCLNHLFSWRPKICRKHSLVL